MNNYPIIHEHTDLTKTDLIEFSVSKARYLADTSRDHYPKEHIGSDNHYYFTIAINALEYDLIMFGFRVVDNGRLDLKRIKNNIWIIKQLFNKAGHHSILTNMKGVFESYYNCFKEAFIQLECYEMLPILEKKYKSIIRLIDKEIKMVGIC